MAPTLSGRRSIASGLYLQWSRASEPCIFVFSSAARQRDRSPHGASAKCGNGDPGLRKRSIRATRPCLFFSCYYQANKRPDHERDRCPRSCFRPVFSETSSGVPRKSETRKPGTRASTEWLIGSLVRRSASRPSIDRHHAAAGDLVVGRSQKQDRGGDLLGLGPGRVVGLRHGGAIGRRVHDRGRDRVDQDA